MAGMTEAHKAGHEQRYHRFTIHVSTLTRYLNSVYLTQSTTEHHQQHQILLHFSRRL